MIRRWKGLAAVVLLTVALGLVLWSRRPVTLFQGESPFGEVRVVEHQDGLRALYIGAGRARQSAVYPERPGHLVHAYTRTAVVGLALAPPEPRLLFVGLGGGAMPSYARRVLPEAGIDVVEIDSVVVHVARRFFGFRPDGRLRVHVADGRAFIDEAPPDSWDVVFLDAFSDDEIPFDLTTHEFLSSVRRTLTPHGVVVANVWTSAPAYRSMVATYQAVFDGVVLLQVAGRRQVILLASPDAGRLARDPLARAARALSAQVDLGFDLSTMVTEHMRLPGAGAAPVLRDSFSPEPSGRGAPSGLP